VKQGLKQAQKNGAETQPGHGAPGCVLLEIKAGPFDPKQPKNLATWAPEEGSAEARDYLNRLVQSISP
jgi:hypothetical protein